jgi:hypothetical protein
MSRWILGCSDCKQDFIHSEIDIDAPIRNPFTGLDHKPDFPAGGLSLQCPRCQKASVYHRHQLVYQAS